MKTTVDQSYAPECFTYEPFAGDPMWHVRACAACGETTWVEVGRIAPAVRHRLLCPDCWGTQEMVWTLGGALSSRADRDLGRAVGDRMYSGGGRRIVDTGAGRHVELRGDRLHPPTLTAARSTGLFYVERLHQAQLDHDLVHRWARCYWRAEEFERTLPGAMQHGTWRVFMPHRDEAHRYERAAYEYERRFRPMVLSSPEHNFVRVLRHSEVGQLLAELVGTLPDLEIPPKTTGVLVCYL